VGGGVVLSEKSPISRIVATKDGVQTRVYMRII
jgi:hypothetical protein